MKILFVVLLLSIVLCISADSCGGNCPSGDCQLCQCGSKPNYVNVTEVCEQFPGWDSKCCECIVNTGSKGNEHAASMHEDGSQVVGLWQIDSKHWNSCGGKAPCSLTSNQECAINLWKQGGGSFKNWPTCGPCGCCGSASGGLSNIKSTSVTATDNVKPIVKPLSEVFKRDISSPDINVTASNCGGNCPGGKCDSCPCGTTPSSQDIATVCAMYDGWDQTCCQCIVKAESGGNANAVNENTNGSFDVGVWQINSVNWKSCSGNSAPCAVSANLQCAQLVYKNGANTFKQWSTCSKCGCCGSSNAATATTSKTLATAVTHATANSGPTNSATSRTTSSSTYTGFAGDMEQRGGEGNLPLDELVKVFKA